MTTEFIPPMFGAENPYSGYEVLIVKPPKDGVLSAAEYQYVEGPTELDGEWE